MEPWEVEIVKIMYARCIRLPGDLRATQPMTATEEIIAVVQALQRQWFGQLEPELDGKGEA